VLLQNKQSIKMAIQASRHSTSLLVVKSYTAK